MAARNARSEPPKDEPAGDAQNGHSGAQKVPSDRYRPLAASGHGLDREAVQQDQRQRLQTALIELIAERGYQAVRIVDLAKLARVSQPTFYGLYTNKEELFIGAYEDIAARAAATAIDAYSKTGPEDQRVRAAVDAFAELAAAEPEAVSLLALGAFGAGPAALEHRKHRIQALEGSIRAVRGRSSTSPADELTIKAVLGGIREVTAARLRAGRASELPGLSGEIAAWAASYPALAPGGLAAPPPERRRRPDAARPAASERARQAEGPLRSGRSAIPRNAILKNQRERIVDATAALVSEKGLSGLTIPEIARRAKISHQTFYEIYPSKHDAFLGALKVGMHQALLVTVEAYDAHKDDWPRAVAAGLRALVDYLASEPAHARLSVVDTFAASPEAIEIRARSLEAFAACLRPGYALAENGAAVPEIAAEAVAGGIWQVLHHFIENEMIAELPEAAPQLIYLALTPFIGPADAAEAARPMPARR
ncbi:MAG: TetR/AcrR family transcriptional regulator [Solirubrobacteraceae bacterium]|jgi:AcrR family transcriptional regulator